MHAAEGELALLRLTPVPGHEIVGAIDALGAGVD
jgi:D-arabinose 1-dehydrogenase-like Zn-dependent alcohol dehydrogenase